MKNSYMYFMTFFFIYRPKMAYKTTNIRYFDEAYQDSAPWEKYQPYHMSLSVGAKRAVLGKY